ncbi:MAG: adenylate/guanylate cyclase domain-containing protein [Burkholderiales bacterium]
MSDRLGTVLFADVSGSTSLYETAGDDAALDAISACLAAARAATEASGGRVVKTMGDEIMSIFPGPDAAANAAADIQARIEALPEIAGKKLGVRVGFHHGAVLQRDDDVFGDTVNLAARLVAQAKKGEIILSTDTAELLGPVFRSMVRELHAITVKGKAEEIGLAELVWKRDMEATVVINVRNRGRIARNALRLRYRGREVTRRRDSDSISIGRDAASGLVVHDEMASRQHCTIERRQEHFVLLDHSTNGTYVTVEGEAELAVRRSEFHLRKRGSISFGQPGGAGVEVVEFFIDD